MSQSEEQIQKETVSFLRTYYPELFFWSTPNGGMSKGENGRRKAMGVRRGMSDLNVLLYGGRIGFIEMKTAKGTLSPEQRAFRDMCKERGIPWALCRSLPDVLDTLRSWGMGPRGVVFLDPQP